MNPQEPQSVNDLDSGVINLAKAIRHVESGDNFDAKGKSGEYGAYQFMPQTWKSWVGEYIGDANAPLTRENQNKVAYYHIKSLKDQGLNPGQIASVWNSGSPDHTNDNHRGVNSQGAAYDTPGYVNKVYSTYQQLKSGGQQPYATDSGASEAQPEASKGKSVSGFLGNIASSGASLLEGIGHSVAHPVETVSGIANLGAGALESGITKGADILGIQHNDVKTPEMQQFKGAVDFYKNRYGGVQNIKDTLYKDPVGAAADASIVLGGAGAVAGKVGELSEAARTASLIREAGGLTAQATGGAVDVGNVIRQGVKGSSLGSKASEVLNKASEVTNPLYLPGKALGGVASGLKKSAENSYTDVLAPTTKQNKFATKGVISGRNVTLPNGEKMHVPGLVDRGIVAGSREGLAERIGQELEGAGKKLSVAEESLPKNAPVKVKPIIDQLEEAKKQFTLNENGKNVIIDQQAVNHLSDFQAKVQELAANDMISRESLTQFKRYLQEKVSKSGAYYGKTLSEGSQIDAANEVERAIRRQLDTEFPDLAKINAEYKFWKDAEKVIKDTIERKRGQSGILRKGLSATVGAIAGAPFGGVAGGAGGAYLAKIGMEAFSSPAWKTVSAITKSRLANALASGKVALAGQILRNVGVPVSRVDQLSGQAQVR